MKKLIVLTIALAFYFGANSQTIKTEYKTA